MACGHDVMTFSDDTDDGDDDGGGVLVWQDMKPTHTIEQSVFGCVCECVLNTPHSQRKQQSSTSS